MPQHGLGLIEGMDRQRAMLHNMMFARRPRIRITVPADMKLCAMASINSILEGEAMVGTKIAALRSSRLAAKATATP